MHGAGAYNHIVAVIIKRHLCGVTGLKVDPCRNSGITGITLTYLSKFPCKVYAVHKDLFIPLRYLDGHVTGPCIYIQYLATPQFSRHRIHKSAVECRHYPTRKQVIVISGRLRHGLLREKAKNSGKNTHVVTTRD